MIIVLSLINDIFASDRDHYREPQLDKMHRSNDHRLPNPNWYIYNTSFTLKTQEL